MGTAYFGGSFDPPHNGHLAVARGALASGECSHVSWAVAFDPPHKLNRKRASFADRMEMVGRLISGEADMSVSDIESRMELHPSYTIDILRAWEKENKERPALLIGADSLLELHTWKEGRVLAQSYRVLTYPRRGCEVSAEKLMNNFNDEKIVKNLLSGVLAGSFFEISSTNLRNSMEKSGFVDNIKEVTETSAAVTAYIEGRKLYRQNPDSLEK